MAASLRLKVTGKTPAYNGGMNYTFMADYQDGRNKEWAEATPVVSFNFSVKAELAELFELGDAVEVIVQKAAE